MFAAHLPAQQHGDVQATTMNTATGATQPSVSCCWAIPAMCSCKPVALPACRWKDATACWLGMHTMIGTCIRSLVCFCHALVRNCTALPCTPYHPGHLDHCIGEVGLRYQSSLQKWGRARSTWPRYVLKRACRLLHSLLWPPYLCPPFLLASELLCNIDRA